MKYKAVVIGGSAGSLDVLLQIVPDLNKDLGVPIIIVQHRRVDNDAALVHLLSSRTTIKIKEAEEKEMIRSGAIYIAPADYHLLIEKDYTFSIDRSEKVNYSRPSIDVTFESAADVYGESLVCILLSGANADGVEGLKTVKSKNGLIIAQDPITAEVPFMPQQAINRLAIDYVLKTGEFAGFINNLD